MMRRSSKQKAPRLMALQSRARSVERMIGPSGPRIEPSNYTIDEQGNLHQIVPLNTELHAQILRTRDIKPSTYESAMAALNEAILRRRG